MSPAAGFAGASSGGFGERGLRASSSSMGARGGESLTADRLRDVFESMYESIAKLSSSMKNNPKFRQVFKDPYKLLKTLRRNLEEVREKDAQRQKRYLDDCKRVALLAFRLRWV